MHKVRPKVYLIAKPSISDGGMREWLDDLGATNYELYQPGTSEAESIVMAAAKRCYMAFDVALNPNLKTIRKNSEEYLDNILDSGHGSVLEHVSFTFAIENVSRVFTGEMNRHRAGMAISEGSMRFISFEDMGLVETETMRNPKDDFDKFACTFVEHIFEYTEKHYTRTMHYMREQGYDDLPFARKKQITSFMRRAIGMGIATGGVWTGNVRALRHIFTMRCAAAAEEEIQEVANALLMIMREECKILFADFSQDADGHWEPLHRKV